jgi:hypothetical protein
MNGLVTEEPGSQNALEKLNGNSKTSEIKLQVRIGRHMARLL